MPTMTRRTLLATGAAGAAAAAVGAASVVGPRTLATDVKHRPRPARGDRPADRRPPVRAAALPDRGGGGGPPPFALAGADGGTLFWEPGHAAGDDPLRMVTDEMPGWLRERGFDTGRMAAWGWSMGGYGVLHLAEVRPRSLRAVAAFSPAVSPGDAVFSGRSRLGGTPLGVWCGRQDPLVADVQKLVAALPERPQIVSYRDGAHTRAFWDSVTLPAFAFVGGRLGAS